MLADHHFRIERLSEVEPNPTGLRVIVSVHLSLSESALLSSIKHTRRLLPGSSTLKLRDILDATLESWTRPRCHLVVAHECLGLIPRCRAEVIEKCEHAKKKS